MIFVFGSNESGIHGMGAALYAKKHYGAKQNVGFGRQGASFAIPTKDWNIKTLMLFEIAFYVGRFLNYAELRPNEDFRLTKIGCGLAGYREYEIASMFSGSPENVKLIDENQNIICLASDWCDLLGVS